MAQPASAADTRIHGLATGEAAFVFTGREAPEVAVGDAIVFHGKAGEYHPGGKGVTEITGATWKATAAQRHSFACEGNPQVLDHLLTSGAPAWTDHAIVHIDAEYADRTGDHVRRYGGSRHDDPASPAVTPLAHVRTPTASWGAVLGS